MRKIKVLTDSCCDLPLEVREKYDLDYARMMTVYNGKETPASLDFEYYTPKQLYDIMRGGERVFTSQVPIDEFERVFKLYLEQEYDIIYVGCSVKQSSSVNTGEMVAKTLMEEYPDAKISCIDSLNTSMGEGLVAIRAAELRDQGLDVDQITEQVVSMRNNVLEYVTVHSLDCLRRCGRVKGSAAFFGNLFGVKPIIISDAEGAQTPIKKVKGRLTSLKEIVNLVKENITDAENQTLYVCHADSEEEAMTVVDMIKAEIPCKEVVVGYIGPITGSSVGPDAIGIFALGKEVTFVG